jgi:molybdopterin molybdotransferase
MVSFYQFVQPALLRLAGVDPLPAAPAAGPCTTRCARPPGAPSSSAACCPGGRRWQVRTTGAQGSGILSSMADANCFIVLGPDQTSVAAGEPVAVQLFDGLV